MQWLIKINKNARQSLHYCSTVAAATDNVRVSRLHNLQKFFAEIKIFSSLRCNFHSQPPFWLGHYHLFLCFFYSLSFLWHQMIAVALFQLFPTAVTAADPKSNKNKIQNPYFWAINFKAYQVIHCFLATGSGKYAFAKQLHKTTISLVSVYLSAKNVTRGHIWDIHKNLSIYSSFG